MGNLEGYNCTSWRQSGKSMGRENSRRVRHRDLKTHRIFREPECGAWETQVKLESGARLGRVSHAAV
jgi:hypothetical protein